MEWWLGIFVLVAALYALVGHGGASGYLSLMSIFNFTIQTIRPTALILNLFVSLIAFVTYARAGHFKFKLFWPFAIASVPMAWLGGTIKVNEQLFKIVLGLFLLFAAARLLGFIKKVAIEPRDFNPVIAAVIGAMLGFVSGLIGIGGGIFLSPVLLLLGWANVKTTAAVSALFIFVNSAAALFGMYCSATVLVSGNVLLLIAAVSLGGFIGGLLGSSKITALRVQKLLAVVLLLAAIKLLLIP